jgi:hypothetical protein
MLCTNSFAQKDKYSSKEENEYYKNLERNFVPFKPFDTEFILGFKSEYYEIHEDELNYESYSFDKYLTPYQDSISKIEDAIHEKIYSLASTAYQYSKELPDSIREVINGLHDSLFLFFQTLEYIGKVEKYRVLKYEKKDNIEAFIYESCEYENIYFGEPGIWIGYSENNGRDWNYYYTGIVQRQPVFVKYYSQRPLIKEKDKLEIDACLLKQLSSFSHPGPGPSYECVKDGIYLVFDINLIKRDSDGDGLTDIVEDKLYLDKYNKDTNEDGVPDNLDTNPRVHYPRTEKSRIYEAMLDDEIDWNKRREIGKLRFNENTTYNVTDSTETVLIITDDKDLMGIKPQKYRIIFMTTDEYQNKTKFYKTELNRMYFSPLFKVDKKRDTYKMTYDFNTWGSEYLIRKTKKGWIVKILSMWIS